MPVHVISDVEQIVESTESGKFYPKVLTGKPGLIPQQMPQGWNFCRDEKNRIVSFGTFKEAEEYLWDRTEQTKQEIKQQIKRENSHL